MSDEQPDGEPSPSFASDWLNSALKAEIEGRSQAQVRRSTKAIPSEDPVLVVQEHLNGMTHAQRGAVSQLIKKIAQLQVELARVKGVDGDREAEKSDKSNGVDAHDHEPGSGWFLSYFRPNAEVWIHESGAEITFSMPGGWQWATKKNDKTQTETGFADTMQEAARLALSGDRLFFAPKVHGKWWVLQAIASTQLTSDAFEDRQREQIANAIVEALKAYDESKGASR